MADIVFKENSIDVDTYLYLRASVGWKKLSYTQAKKALKNSLYTVYAEIDGRPVGMGRVVGDGAVICYIQDLIVTPEIQGQGVGRKLIGHLKEFVLGISEENTEMMLALMCAKGREKFYEKYGFIARPTPNLGPGMIMYLHKSIEDYAGDSIMSLPDNRVRAVGGRICAADNARGKEKACKDDGESIQ
ncbi:MAG: GNAT family N-acetyltransferase [Lachnospiraceae bacterium]|nr:GNAT family N-acetyltransferase [Lachnospiraceae bacterium]